MGMFETTGKSFENQLRKPNTLQKLERMNTTLQHQEPDRVPISDFFWGSFIQRWRKDLNLPDDANPYYYYDLDWIVTVPNMDPFIRSFETIKENSEEVVVKTGFKAIMRKKFDAPMPEFIAFESDTLEKLEALTSVCSVGLDMVPVPGDITEETLAGIIADEMAIGMINAKTTACRIIPVPGKKAGESVHFGGLLGEAKIMAVPHMMETNAFMRYGGRIPAPIHSLKN